MKHFNYILKELSLSWKDCLVSTICSLILTMTFVFSFSIGLSYKKNNLKDFVSIDFQFEKDEINNQLSEVIDSFGESNGLIYISTVWNYTFGNNESEIPKPSIKKDSEYKYLANSEDKMGALFLYNDTFFDMINKNGDANTIYLSNVLFEDMNIKENEEVTVYFGDDYKQMKIGILPTDSKYNFIMPIDIFDYNSDENYFLTVSLKDFSKYDSFCKKLSEITNTNVSSLEYDEIIKTSNLTFGVLITVSFLTFLILFFIFLRISNKILDQRINQIALSRALGKSKMKIIIDYFIIIGLGYLLGALLAWGLIYGEIGIFNYKLNKISTTSFNFLYINILMPSIIVFQLLGIFISIVLLINRLNKKELMKIYRGTV